MKGQLERGDIVEVHFFEKTGDIIQELWIPALVVHLDERFLSVQQIGEKNFPGYDENLMVLDIHSRKVTWRASLEYGRGLKMTVNAEKTNCGEVSNG